MPKDVQAQVLKRAGELTKDILWDGKEWVADYRRLRAIAHK